MGVFVEVFVGGVLCKTGEDGEGGNSVVAAVFGGTWTWLAEALQDMSYAVAPIVLLSGDMGVGADVVVSALGVSVGCG